MTLREEEVKGPKYEFGKSYTWPNLSFKPSLELITTYFSYKYSSLSVTLMVSTFQAVTWVVHTDLSL